MPDLAVSGSPPDYLPGCNVFDWLFSNPFMSGSEVLRSAPTDRGENHAALQVPVEKPILISAASGTNLSWQRLQQDALKIAAKFNTCLLYTSPSPRDGLLSRMPSSA